MLQQLGFDRDRFRILVNRTNRRDGISTADMEKIFSSPVFATVPNDFFALHKAVTRAEPLSTDTEISRSFDHLAHRIAGINGKDRKSGAAVVEAKAVLSEG
jgi:pilus assembly protein CpaE